MSINWKKRAPLARPTLAEVRKYGVSEIAKKEIEERVKSLTDDLERSIFASEPSLFTEPDIKPDLTLKDLEESMAKLKKIAMDTGVPIFTRAQAPRPSMHTFGLLGDFPTPKKDALITRLYGMPAKVEEPKYVDFFRGRDATLTVRLLDSDRPAEEIKIGGFSEHHIGIDWADDSYLKEAPPPKKLSFSMEAKVVKGGLDLDEAFPPPEKKY